MNGWYEGASEAARDAIRRYRQQAENDAQIRQARAIRAARPNRFRRSAASALRRLADALAPQAGDAIA